MDPVQKREMKRQAWLRLTAQKRRAGLLRGRVVALSLICLVVLWGIVFAQMATGNDPVLSAKEQAVASTGAAKRGRKEVETTGPRELESERATDAVPSEEGAVTEPEFEEFTEAEPGFEGFEETEPEFEEPLVTSQS